MRVVSPDRENKVPHPEALGFGPRGRLKPDVRGAEHGEVRCRVAPDEFSFNRLAIGQAEAEVVIALHGMVCRHHDAVFVPHHAACLTAPPPLHADHARPDVRYGLGDGFGELRQRASVCCLFHDASPGLDFGCSHRIAVAPAAAHPAVG